MTAQVQDKIKYKNKEYSIIAMTNPLEFNPEDYGITPSTFCTACWRGFWCDYEISDTEIYLGDLFINSDNDEYPLIEGVSVSNYTGRDNMGHHVYQNLNIKLPYTGKILLGNEFISEYYIHMGFQYPWTYKILKEFSFKDGKLLTVIDCSDIAGELRDKINADPDFMSNLKGNLIEFIDDTFSLNYSVKAWWLKKD